MKAKKMAAIAAAIAIVGAGGMSLAASRVVEAAKANCIVGERLDGYLGVVAGQTASGEVKREIDAINLKRKAAYAQLAADRGVTIDATAAIAAKQLIERSASGHCVQDDGGVWVKVP
ncbi:MAG: DUF1318 domain-containing protein [Alphaproteobacteria bacterium]|nr:DUF1318 domain-containing protein [Alphaproteobacteria bacterium]